METLIEQLISKMGLRDEPNVLEKTRELVRRLELKSSNVPLQVNEYGKIVLCADLAAVMLGIAFDKENAVKLSGLRKSHYDKNKRMFEKLLDLNKVVNVNDICIQLGLNEVTKKANELLELYKYTVANESADTDMSHPQYAAMAVLQACKLSKKKISKPKILSFSNLRPSQWNQLELRWDKFITKHGKDLLKHKFQKQDGDSNAAKDECQKTKLQKSGEKRQKVANGVEDYNLWKKRMLQMAELKLKDVQIEKENIESILS